MLQIALVAAVPSISRAQEPRGRYVVALKKGSDPDATANEHGRKYGVTKQMVYRNALDGYAATVPESRVDDLRSDPSVISVFADLPAHAAVQTTPTGVSRIRASSSLANGAGINVAVIDTGIDLNHPDLATNIAGGMNCSDGSSYDDSSSMGHGTHVAGIIAALDNSIGVRGVAPAAKLWAVRVLDDTGSGSFSTLICGLDFVDSKSPANGGTITVANMSIEADDPNADDGNCGYTNGDPFHQAVCRVVADGVTLVVAAGNDTTDVRNIAPAAYDEVITTSALSDSDGQPCGLGPPATFGADDTFASFSNYAGLSSDKAHTLGAPGDDIYSTWNNGGYTEMSGTSMASPHVAGTAALYISAHPGSKPAAVLAGLKAAGVAPGVNFNGECPSGASATDPSGKHPEAIVRVSSIFVIQPPGDATASIGVLFQGAVDGVDETNLILQLASGGAPIPAAVTYDVSTHLATVDPTGPLLPGEHYEITVAPQGSTPPTDSNGDPLPTTTNTFRAGLVEQETSVWTEYFWGAVSTSSAYGSRLVRDRTANASAAFTFTGTSVSWYTMRGPDQGLARVEIDGASRGTFDNYHSSAQYRYKRTWSVGAGAHTIRIVALGKKGTHARDTYVSIDAFGVGSTLYSNPMLASVWSIAASSVALGDHFARDSSTGASMYFHFRGTKVQWRAILGPYEGKAKVYVDGVYKALIDNYASSTRVAWRSVGGLADRVHYIRVMVAGVKNASSKNTYVSVDCFLVG